MSAVRVRHRPPLFIGLAVDYREIPSARLRQHIVVRTAQSLLFPGLIICGNTHVTQRADDLDGFLIKRMSLVGQEIRLAFKLAIYDDINLLAEPIGLAVEADLQNLGMGYACKKLQAVISGLSVFHGYGKENNMPDHFMPNLVTSTAAQGSG